MHNLNNANFINKFIIRLFIRLLTNRLELNISIFKTNFFCKDIILKIVAIDNIDYIIVFLKRILFIISNCSINSLFNINKNIFNRKRIINIFC